MKMEMMQKSCDTAPRPAVAPAEHPVARRGRLLERVTLGFNALFLVWILSHPSSPFVFRSVANVFEMVGPLLAGAWCLAQLHLVSPERRWAIAALGLGVIGYGVGQTIWSYYEIVLRHDCPFPSWSDAGYLSAYPFLLFGVLMMPRRRLPSALRGRVVLDGLMTMAGLLTFSWYFILGPTLQQGAETLLGKAVGMAYPLMDVVLLFCLLVLAAQDGAGRLRETWLVALGMAAVVVADTVFAFKTLHGAFQTGGWSDLGWPLGYMLVGAGGCAVAGGRAAPSGAGERTLMDRQRVLWRSLAPYALVPAVGALLVGTHFNHGDDKLERGVWVGAAALTGLLLMRQVFAILENGKLYRYLQETYRDLEAQHAELAEARQTLEMKNRSLAAANARLEGLATTDGLTGLKNHRAFYERLQAEWDTGRDAERPLSLILLDVDRFKMYNDSYGHPAGDEVLKTVAQVLADNCRDTDLAARYGGEEFVIILPQAGEGAALALAERFRAGIAAQPWPRRPVTASFGVSTSVRSADGPDALIAAADRALYLSKEGGRNRVTAAGCLEGLAPLREQIAA